jgi:anaphase-promoting complex subunit 6
MGFGTSFAVQDESDQALAAYRTAARIFQGSHYPVIYIGMEYLKTNNVDLASQFFHEANLMCPTDPLVHNETGVVLYMNNSYSKAVDHFEYALSLVSEDALEAWEPTLFNLGHALRKLGNYQRALKYYKMALSVMPRNPSVLGAIGFTYHLYGAVPRAIDYYHKALALSPRDTFITDMLGTAIAEQDRASKF